MANNTKLHRLAQLVLRLVHEDAPVNAAGTGGVAGIGVGDKGEPGVDLRKKKKKPEDVELEERAAGRLRKLQARIHEEVKTDTFAGADVFETDMDRVLTSRFGKNRYHRYSKYVGQDETGEAIRQVGRTTKRDIVLKDAATGVMVYLRRKQKKA